MQALQSTAQQLVATGKGILAADESFNTIAKRFKSIDLSSTEKNRAAYRELLLSTAGIEDYVSGVILFDETIRQKGTSGKKLVDLLLAKSIVPGIKVDMGAKPLALCPGEKVTEGLDGLRERLQEYHKLGARFAKWRAVITIADNALPSATCINTNAHALARYAALCQEQGIVPIVEPEVLMDGTHTIERCAAITKQVLQATFSQLHQQRIMLEGMLLKPNMVIAAQDCPQQQDTATVATSTAACLRHCVPANLPGIVFLSGGQSEQVATEHLNAMNSGEVLPWHLSFSYGRALQHSALQTWGGKSKNKEKAQQIFLHRCRMNSLAARGEYRTELESGKEPGE